MDPSTDSQDKGGQVPHRAGLEGAEDLVVRESLARRPVQGVERVLRREGVGRGGEGLGGTPEVRGDARVLVPAGGPPG